MYIIFTKPVKLKSFIKHPFAWIIRLFSQSKFSHTAYTAIMGARIYVSEAVSPRYRHILVNDFLKERKHYKIYAYRVIKEIDHIELEKHELKQIGKKYDLKGAIYSESHKWGILGKLFKRKKDDVNPFCSEAGIEMLKNQGWIKGDINENYYSPQEYYELLIDNRLIDAKPEIWSYGR